jgi:NAD(P)-dependent dehydrogenase (short-subunit alcohol dehydrogenase family)
MPPYFGDETRTSPRFTFAGAPFPDPDGRSDHACCDGGQDMRDKVAIVTGGTSGIGRAAAVALAAAGARVVVGSRREKEGGELVAAIEAAGGQALFVRTDVADEADVARLVEAATSSHGRLDLAFNNAGIELGGPVEAITHADFRRVFDINVWGVAAAMKHEVAAMLRTGAGAIVNTSSITGHVGIADFSLYNASKHAVEGLTKTAALELAGRGIRVNAVAPAFIATPMVERFVGAAGEARDELAAMHPVGRLGRVDEVVAAVMFLLSDQSAFTTGVSLPVDGGWTAR